VITHEFLSLIRAYVIDYAKIGFDISMYFKKIDKEIMLIDNIAGYPIDSLTNDQIVDRIGGITVVKDDIYIAHQKSEDMLMQNTYGTCIVRNKKNKGESPDYYRRSISNKEGVEIEILDDKKFVVTITISEGVHELKDNQDPIKRKWYEAMLAHELSHQYMMKYRESLITDKLTDDEIEMNIVDPRKIADEVLCDRVGINIAGLSKLEYIKMQLWFEDETSRLRDKYIAYLKTEGFDSNSIIYQNTVKPLDVQIKDIRIKLGGKVNHILDNPDYWESEVYTEK
jgi:hypothetical protein